YDDPDGTPYWYSVNPRMVLFPEKFKLSKSLRRIIKSGQFEVRIDTCFDQVIRNCASISRKSEPDTWISPNFIESYNELHKLGFAHSFETFQDGELVGGLYGVSLGGIFSGESMFAKVSNASKVAFARLVDYCLMHNFLLIDAQSGTDHVMSLGAELIPRTDFLKMVENSLAVEPTIQGQWKSHSVALLLGSNMGDCSMNLVEACKQIESEIGVISRDSECYETEPWGFESKSNFLNMALVVETDLPPQEVMRRALLIEDNLGRVRSMPQDGSNDRHYEDRPIDIDIMFYDNMVANLPTQEGLPALILPHPRLHLREFALRPLCDVMRKYKHPILNRTIEELFQDLS
ncbi:MAG: leucyl/phenylalanyl-tRNA--protein transferase, partial [Bacteroidales bacterium]|nr:leucyl/phenylalanyl-tRNA--protein transferase [Candidatus Colimorpha onthohippi]